jgi:HK97 family phage major capsid protein
MNKDQIKAALKKELAAKGIKAGASATGTPTKAAPSLGRTQSPWAGGTAQGLFGGGAPNVMTGERNSADRPYSFQKAIQVAYGIIPPDQAKVEMEASDNLKSVYLNVVGPRPQSAIFVPLAHYILPDEAADSAYFKCLHAAVKSGLGQQHAQYDPDEIRHALKAFMKANPGMATKAQSYNDPTLGGALFGGPVVGELIDLLRPKTPFSRAKWAALPPLGLKMPRVAGMERSTWASENQKVNATEVTFSPIDIKPKKLMQIIDYPNEMVTYGSPSISAWMTHLLTEQLGVEFAAGALEGAGTDTAPLGIKTMAELQASDPDNYDFGINLVTMRDLRDHPEDIMRLPKAAERKNGEVTEFIGHPDSFWAFLESRASAVLAGDQAGPFVYSFARAARDGFPDEVLGRPFNKTTLVAVDAENPTENETYIIGMKMDEFYCGTIGAVEITTSVEGGDRFDRDQTGLRAKMYANCTPERTSNVVVALNVPSPVNVA